jgi:hypothetical protein
MPIVRRHRNRFRIVRAAVLLALPFAAAACTDKKAEIDSQAQALRETAAGGVVSSLRAGDPAPRAQEAQALWITRRGLAAMKHLTDSVSKQYGIDINKPPAAYGTQEYYGNPADHPEVREYFEQYAAYARDMREHAFAWLRRSLSEDMAQTRLGSDFEREMLRGLDSKVPPFQRAMETAGNAATEMVQLHDFLVSIDDRVHYSPSRREVSFDRQSDMARAQEMEQHARAAFQETAQYAARAEQEGRQQLQAVTTQLGGS